MRPLAFAESSRDLYPWNPRRTARHVVLSALATAQAYPHGVRRDLTRDRVQLLYFHHIFQDEADSFRRLLTSLAKNHRFVSYAEAVRRIEANDIDGAYVAFSFDDGFKNCLMAARILEDFGTTACFFVCPSIVGEVNYGRIARFTRERLGIPPVEFMSWDDLEGLLSRGHEVGGHGLDHRDLGALTGAALLEEIEGCYQVLSERLGSPAHFSWPFGLFRHFSSEAATRVFESGYRSCASAVRGCHVSSRELDRRACLRRDVVQARWAARHVDYLLARNARSRAVEGGSWPPGWRLRGGL